jgi:hypothetical protein
MLVWRWSKERPEHVAIVRYQYHILLDGINCLFYCNKRNSMQKSPSWETNRISASQEIPWILWDPRAHYHIYKHPTAVSVLRQISPVHVFPPHFLKIHLIRYFPGRTGSWHSAYQSVSPSPRPCEMFRDIVGFYGEDLLAPRSTTKLEDHSLSAFCDCLFIIFAAAFHIGDRCSIRKMRTRPSVVTGTHSLLWDTASFVKMGPDVSKQRNFFETTQHVIPEEGSPKYVDVFFIALSWTVSGRICGP